MLTLGDSLQIGRCTLFRDVTYSGGRRSYSPTFYALPEAPRLALGPDGLPALDLLLYRFPPEQPAERSGGLLTFTVELAPSPAERERLAREAQAAAGLDAAVSPQILPVPFKAGTVSVSVAAEQGEGELVRQLAGGGPARLLGSQRAAFLGELTRTGAALVAAAFERGLALLHVRYDLLFEHRIDDAALRVWCDARRAHAFAAAQGEPWPSPAELQRTLVDERLAGVELLARRPLAGPRREALEALGRKLLAAALEQAFFEAPGAAGGSRSLKPLHAAAELTLNHTFGETYPAEEHAVLEDALAVTLPPERVRTVSLDRGFFDLLVVTFYCTADFSAGLVDKVLVHVVYDETGAGGHVRREADLVFAEGHEVQTFRADLADPAARRYRYEAAVYYRGRTEPTRFSSPLLEGDAVVLDLDGLGVLRAAFELRDAPLDSLQAVVVDLQYPGQGRTHKLVLDGAHPQAEWALVVAEAPGPYRYRVTWVSADSRRIEEAWRDTRATRVFLDAPAVLAGGATVLLVAAGSFDSVAQVVVELETAAGEERAELAFTAAGESRTWRPRGVSAPWRYRARRTLVGRDGSVRALGWTDEDAPVLVVADLLHFEVRIVPRRLDLGGTLRLAVVELEPLSGEGRASFVLREREASARWSFRLTDPDQRTYRYRLTLHHREGAPLQTSWQESRDAILVLPPSLA